MANGLDVHRGSWPKMSNNTYTRLAVPGLSGSLSFDIQKVHSGKLEELEAAEIIAFEWVTFSDKNFQENHLTIIPSFSGDTEEDMAAAALSRRQTTQVCTQGRKKVKLIQKDYLDQLFFKKKKYCGRETNTNNYSISTYNSKIKERERPCPCCGEVRSRPISCTRWFPNCCFISLNTCSTQMWSNILLWGGMPSKGQCQTSGFLRNQSQRYVLTFCGLRNAKPFAGKSRWNMVWKIYASIRFRPKLV